MFPHGHQLELLAHSVNALAALLVGISGAAGDDATGFLLAQPVSRREHLVGRWLGQAAALSLSIVFGFGTGSGVVSIVSGADDIGRFAVLVGACFLASFVFLSIATLIAAPTGSGKTLAAFLVFLDRLAREPDRQREGVRVLYVTPLKALGDDIHRNLELPLEGMTRLAGRLGRPQPGITTGIRSGDTPQRERTRLTREPPDVLITTPESLYLMLTSERAARTLASVEAVIVDEVHALAVTSGNLDVIPTFLDTLGEFFGTLAAAVHVPGFGDQILAGIRGVLDLDLCELLELTPC